jgi:hypothetical protein
MCIGVTDRRTQARVLLPESHHPLWVRAKTILIRGHCDEHFRCFHIHFRWFHIGVVQDQNHLQNICTIARQTAGVRHCLPTREYEIVRASKGELPENLIVRVSAMRIDGQPPRWWLTTPMVVSCQE